MADEQVVIHKQVDDSKDSIEWGTPSKGGAIKVYGDSMKPEEFKKKVDNMKSVQAHALQGV